MPLYQVQLDVDGKPITEEVNGKDATEAIRFARQRHLVRAIEVRPLTEQLDLTNGATPVHPEQTADPGPEGTGTRCYTFGCDEDVVEGTDHCAEHQRDEASQAEPGPDLDDVEAED